MIMRYINHILLIYLLTAWSRELSSVGFCHFMPCFTS